MTTSIKAKPLRLRYLILNILSCEAYHGCLYSSQSLDIWLGRPKQLFVKSFYHFDKKNKYKEVQRKKARFLEKD
jgi:hypothetical protein